MTLTAKEALISLACTKTGTGKKSATAVDGCVRGKTKVIATEAVLGALPLDADDAMALWRELVDDGIAVDATAGKGKPKFKLAVGYVMPADLRARAFPSAAKQTPVVKKAPASKKPTATNRLDEIERRLAELEATVARLSGTHRPAGRSFDQPAGTPCDEATGTPFDEANARDVIRQTYDSLRSRLNAQAVPIPLIRQATKGRIPDDRFEALLRGMEQEYLVDLQAASHIEAVPPEQRRGVIQDPYRGVLYYVYWRR